MEVVDELEFCAKERFLNKQVLTSPMSGETNCQPLQQSIDPPWLVVNMKPWVSPW